MKDVHNLIVFREEEEKEAKLTEKVFAVQQEEALDGDGGQEHEGSHKKI